MKTLIKTLLVLLISLNTSCQSDDDDGGGDPINQLPEATQTGENTAGCLVDGVPLTPKSNGGIGSVFQCFYQQVDGEFFFNISFTDNTGEDNLNVSVRSRMMEISEGETYILNIDAFSESGYGAVYGGSSTSFYSTSTNNTGQLTISKLDFDNNIVSGTFFFDAVNNSGETVSITEGRFDAQFTQ